MEADGGWNDRECYIGDQEETPSFVSWNRVEEISFVGILSWLWDALEEYDASERIAFLPYGRKPCLRFDIISLLDNESSTSAYWIEYMDIGIWWHDLPWIDSVVFVVHSEEEKVEVETQLATVQNSGWREKSTVVLEER